MDNKKNTNIIVGALRECTTRKDLEDVFRRFKHTELSEKISLLLEAMGNPQVFFSNGTPTDEQRYELAIQMFLTMSWKFSLICRERAL
jgi:hypothetical protein